MEKKTYVKAAAEVVEFGSAENVTNVVTDCYGSCTGGNGSGQLWGPVSGC